MRGEGGGGTGSKLGGVGKDVGGVGGTIIKIVAFGKKISLS